jgi:pentatricopeptide repeat protein
MNPSDESGGPDGSRFRPPVEKDIFRSESESLLNHGLFYEAISLARRRLNLVPGDVDARMVCGLALAGMGKTGESLEVFEEIKKDILSWVRLFEHLGDMFLGKGEIESARICYQTLIQLGPDMSATERLQKKIDSLHEVERGHADKLIDDVSHDFKTITMADLYVRQGHLDMARKVLKEMVLSDPGNMRAVERLREVESLIDGKTPASREERLKAILRELDRWLKNVERLGHHG